MALIEEWIRNTVNNKIENRNEDGIKDMTIIIEEIDEEEKKEDIDLLYIIFLLRNVEDRYEL